MPTLVVTAQGSQIRVSGGQVRVEADGEMLSRLPAEQVERVLVLGSVGMTTGFLDLAFSRGIPVTFLTQDGAWKGRLDPGGLRNAEARLKQYRLLEDTEWRLRQSCRVTLAKIENQRKLLMRSQRNHRLAGIQETIDTLAEIMRKEVPAAISLPQLMGIEGNAARYYFPALRLCLRRPIPMHGRSRRPPKDPMNALLSLGYGMLTAEIIGALAGLGLDPQIGFFHSPRGRMPALAQDIIETFRAPAADGCALTLINLGILTEDDFETRQDDGGVFLKKEALSVYFRQFRRRMTATFHDRNGQRTSFRREIQLMCEGVRRAYLDTGDIAPFEWPQGGGNRC